MIINKKHDNNSFDNHNCAKRSVFFYMLRGINKQIIEIKCPNNECFEKILLFVKSEN